MSYTNLASVKTALGISGTEQDLVLSQLIADADIYLNKELNIDGFLSGETTEKIKFNPQSYSQRGYLVLRLKNFNVKLIKEINGKVYTGVDSVDYEIENSRCLNIRNIHEYFVPVHFNSVTVKYTYGRDALPADITLMSRLLVVGMYNEKYPMGYGIKETGQVNMQGVTTYKLGDESISWAKTSIGDITSWKSLEDRSMFTNLFMKYKKNENVVR